MVCNMLTPTLSLARNVKNLGNSLCVEDSETEIEQRGNQQCFHGKSHGSQHSSVNNTKSVRHKPTINLITTSDNKLFWALLKLLNQ